MSEQLPPNVIIFNGINYNSQFFSADNSGLTFDEASTLFLRFPNAQGTENLQAIVVNKTSDLYDNLTMKNTTPAKRVIQCGDFKMDNNAGAGGTPILQIYSSGETNYYKSLVSSNTSAINFQLKNTGGATITPLILTPLNSTFSTGITADNGMTVNGTSAIFNTGINVYATSTFDGNINLAASRTLNINNTAKIDVLSGGKINIKAGGNVTFDTNTLGDAVTMGDMKIQMTNTKLNMNTTAITQTGFCSNQMQNINMNTAANIIFATQVGRIYQPVADALFVNRNEFKRTDVYIKSGSTAGFNDIAFKVYDALTGSDERGVIMLPNALSGVTSYNNIVNSQDSVIASSNTAGSNNALCVTCYSTDRIGMRLNARTSGAPQVELMAGANVFTMTNTLTNFNTTTSFNKKTEIAINSGSGVGSSNASLDIYDTYAGDPVGPPIIPSADGRGLMVIANASVGAYNSLVQFGDSCIVSKSNTADTNSLTLTCSTVDKLGIRLDGRTVTSPTISISAGGDNILINKNENAFYKPVTFNNNLYNSSPSTASSQLGYIYSSFFSASSIPSNTTTSLGNYSVPRGVWRIDCNFSTNAPSLANFSNYQVAISTANAVFPSAGTSLKASEYNLINPSIPIGKNLSLNSSCTFSNTSGATTIYFIVNFVWSGSATVLCGCNYTITRIG